MHGQERRAQRERLLIWEEAHNEDVGDAGRDRDAAAVVVEVVEQEALWVVL